MHRPTSYFIGCAVTSALVSDRLWPAFACGRLDTVMADTDRSNTGSLSWE
jgi:hypothetical protein